VALGGAAVIGAITLIFAYLLWVVAPIFIPGDIDPNIEFAVVERPTALVDVSENGSVFQRISTSGIVEFYGAGDGVPIAAFDLKTPVADASRVYPEVDVYALITPQNEVLFLRTRYLVSFTDDVRQLTPKLSFPYSQQRIDLGPHHSFDALAFGNELTLATSLERTLTVRRYKGARNGSKLPTPTQVEISTQIVPARLFLGPRAQWVYAISREGELEVIDLRSFAAITRLYRGRLVADGVDMTAVEPLLGRQSLMVADTSGGVVQWSMYKQPGGTHVEPIRAFETETPVRRFIMEPRRKGFATLEGNGNLSLFYPTSGRLIAEFVASVDPNAAVAISPRSDAFISAPDDRSIRALELDNKHPEISFNTLWGKVWYEGYAEPIFSWQSSSADTDFEPKFSLTPLAFGTLKAAFYALLFAVPLAIMGAIYTAYFMAPQMRSWVKPGIEIMASLPTVILGFIGGLWLAPVIESHLSSTLSVLLMLPLGLFIFALVWSRLPDRWTKRFAGWYGLLVTPLIVAMLIAAFDMGPWLEQTLFDGNSRAWIRETFGLNYDQRNALVVGIVMGLAVIPNIFSIAEDAIYGVPTHLTNGSLALGATPWQTLVHVVLLTARPGIFSAVMIGMGRAVGETMIVLMATGNTPLMDFNIFEGMRTFAANIAVELPESEVASSHYRILFLAALVLFILTFIFNTFAEIVRQRLRVRYGSL
jgi:phosphate transport system permease protein